MLTRRDVLASFLGASVAASCRTKPREALPPGEIVGASVDTGHKLREFARVQPTQWESHDVVIVGAGIAGLAAAWRLAKGGIRDMVMLELEPAIGGTSRSGQAMPWGAHYVIAPSDEDLVLRRLLDEMGIYEDGAIAEQFLCRDPQERLFYRGRWYEGLYLFAGASAEDLRQLRAFESEIARWAAWRDRKGRRAFTIPIARCSDDGEVTALDRISMDEWMRVRGFDSPRLRWFVEYACRDDYGTLLADTSAWAAIFYFASRDDGGEERATITWPEGNGRIVRHLAQFAPARTGALVADIRPTESGADVIVLRDGTASGIHARRVIFAGPQFVAARVIAPWRDARPSHVDAFTYGSWMVANVALRDRPAVSGFPLAWDNVLYESPSLGYVVATHQQGIDRGPTVLTYYYALCGSDYTAERERLLATGRDEWADVILTDLARAHPDIRSLAGRIDVMRWGHAMVRPTPGFIWSPSRHDASRPFRSIHFANTDLSGLALCEESLDHGVRAAEEVLEGMGVKGGSWRV